MAFIFIKQIISKIVSSVGGLVFGKLSAETQKRPALVLTDGQLDISKLNLPRGIYTITVTACADGLAESMQSNEEIIIVKSK